MLIPGTTLIKNGSSFPPPYLFRATRLFGREEYLGSVRGRHNMKSNQRHIEIATGDVVLIKGDNKHRDKWNIGIVEKLYEGKDNVIRAIKFRSRKTYI